MLKLSRTVLSLGLIALPLLFNPWEIRGFEGPKIWFFQRWVEVLVFLVVVRFFRTKTFQEISGSQIVVGYFFWTVLTSLLGLDPQTSIYGLVWRGQGLIMLAHYLAFVLIVPPLINGHLKFLGRLLVICSLCVGLSLVIWVVGNKFLNWPILTYFDRPVGTFGNPNFLAGYLAVCLPLAWYFSSWRKWLIIALSLVAIYLTGSRGAIAAVGVTGLAAIMVRIKTRWGIKRALVICFVGSAILIAGSWVAANKLTIVFRSDQKCPYLSGCENVAASRQRIYVRGLLAFVKRPLTGYGLENYELAVQNIEYPFKIAPEFDVIVDKAHNELLEILVGQGVVGLVLWLIIVAMVGWNLYRSKEWLWLAALAIYFLKAQTNVVATPEYVLFWLIVAVGLSEKETVR